MDTEKQDNNKSDFKSAAWKSLEDSWAKTKDLWESPLDIRKKRDAYLKNFEKESATKYQYRLDNSVFQNEFRTTIETFGGTVFRADPSPIQVPKPILALFNNIDRKGTTLYAFLLRAFELFLRDGNGYFLVDAPPFEDKGKTPTKKDRAGDRPHWVFYTAAQVINHREDAAGNWTQATIQETVMRPDGEFGEKQVIQNKIIRIGEYEIQEYSEKEQSFMPGTPINTGLDFFPLYAIADIANRPPLLTLAMLNEQHYNQTSDFDNICHYVCNPRWIEQYATKEDAAAAKELNTSPATGKKLVGEASAYYVEVKGEGMMIAKDRYKDIETQMDKIGMGMLAPSIVPQTATEVADKAARKESRLAKFTRDFSSAVEKALVGTAQYINAIQGKNTISEADMQKAELKLKIGFDKLTFSLNELEFLKQELEAGRLSIKTYLEIRQDDLELPTTPEEEIERIIEERGGEFRTQIDDETEI